ncbi:helix-turn-helix domain-containing protein [Paeniglutamicibacter cryotolerans]|uniref:AraC-like DNA-binding protein n=1 Tax=Paeniglutamicibacter cryotolerans TaxID=670079 RepID=A0A839QIT9_9MICC|nr:helix-turn-helix domain-containing protein [Paeniglutamicibacter cryotolerans]MBB2994455.1 AraC-like DNA-binding protein [Paeniglutamicibacter cryotolerans]
MYQVNSAETFAQWRQLVSESFVALDSQQWTPGEFRGTLRGHQFAELAIVEVSATAHRVLRTPQLISESTDRYYKLSMQVSGRGILRQDGREAVLTPGGFVIYDTERPYTLSFDEEFKTLVMMLPQQLIDLPAEDIAELTAVRMGETTGLGRAIVPFLAQLGEMLPELDGPIGHRLAMNLIDLLATVLADEVSSRPARANAEQSRQLRRIQQFIDGQLANPMLTPGLIASAHFMSTRSLHKAFGETGSTVATWIREHRLERCRRDLLDPLQAEAPVGTIGTRWGLPDAAHFSRIFRAAYGESPVSYRRSALLDPGLCRAA